MLAFTVKATATEPKVKLDFPDKAGGKTVVHDKTDAATVSKDAVLGSTPKGTFITKTFTLTNNTGHTLNLKRNGVSRVDGSATFTVATHFDANKRSLANGATTRFTLKFNPTQATTAGEQTARFNIEYMHGSTPKSLLAFTVKATATESPAYDVSVADSGKKILSHDTETTLAAVAGNTAATSWDFTIENTGSGSHASSFRAGPVAAGPMVPANAFTIVDNIDTGSIDPDGTQTFRIRFNPPASADAASAEFDIPIRAGSDNRLVTTWKLKLGVPVARPAIDFREDGAAALADGATVAFGKVGHGKTVTRTLVLVNNTASDLVLERAITGDANGFSLRMEADSPPIGPRGLPTVPAATTTLGANREKRFILSFSPADAAAVGSTQNAAFSIRYRRQASASPVVLRTVNASATVGVWPVALGFDGGTNGAVVPVTTEANFNSTFADTPVTKTFTLTNNGDQTLFLKADGVIRASGSNTFSAVSDAWNRTSRVESGKTATFGIRFDPKGVATPADGASASFTLQRVRGSGAANFVTFTVRAVASPLTGAAAIGLAVRGSGDAPTDTPLVQNGTVPLGEVALFATRSQTLVVTNTSGADLTLGSEGDANGFSLRAMGTPAPVNGRVTLKHGDTRTFRLAFTPPAASASRFGTKTATFTIKTATNAPLRSFTASASVIAPPVTVAGPANLDAASARESGVAVDLGRIAKTAGKKTYAFKIHNGATATGFRIGQIVRESGPSAFTVKAAPPANSDLAAGSGGLDVQIEFDPAARDAFTGARSDAIFNIAVNAATATGDAEAWHYKLSLRLDVTGDAGLPAIRVAGPAAPDLAQAKATGDVFSFTTSAGAADSDKTFTIYSTGNAGVWIGEARKKPDTGAVFSLKAQRGQKVLQAARPGHPGDTDKTTFVLTFAPPVEAGTHEATFEIPVHRVQTFTGGGDGTKGDAVSVYVLKLKATVNAVPLVLQPLAGPFAVNEDAGKDEKIGKADGKDGTTSVVLTATRGIKTVPATTFTLSGEGAPYFTVNAAGEIVRSAVKIVPPGDYSLKITAKAGDDTSKPLDITVTVVDNVRPKVTTEGDVTLATGSPGVRLETDTHATGFDFVGDGQPAWLKLDKKTGLLSMDAATIPAAAREKGHVVTVRASDAGGDGPPRDITVVPGANPTHGLTVTVALLPDPPAPERSFGLTVAATGGGAPARVFGKAQTFSVRAASGKPGSVRIPRPSGLKGAPLPLRVASGTLPEGFRIVKVACDAGVKAGDVDLATGHFSVSLGMANVTCTVSVSAAGYAAKVVRLTEAAIDRLLDRRVDLLVGDSLNLPARFQGSGGSSGSMGPGPVGVGFTATDSRNMNVSLGTSLAQLRGHAQRDAAHRAALNAGKLGLEVPFQTARAGEMAEPRYDIWGRVRYTTFADKVSSEGKSVDYKGTALIASLGGDIRITEDVLVGLMGRLDRMEGKLDGPGGDADGTGWMVGPYVAARFGPERNLFAEAQGLWGQSDNKVDPLGTYKDSFRTSRWQVSGKLSGTFDLGPVRLVPVAGVSWFTESQQAYTDRNGYRIGGRDISIGRLQFGPGLSRDFALGGATLTVTGGIDGIWNFARPKQRHASSLDKTGDTFRGQGKLGVDLRLPSGLAVGMAGRYDGIGAKNREAWGGEINVRLPLN